MAKKREDKLKHLEIELSDLHQIEQGRVDGSLDLATFREELSHRGFQSTDDFQKRINTLMLKLGVKQDAALEEEQAELNN